MGAIKDVVDLTTQLANSVEDRRVATELLSIQRLILAVQAEQQDIHQKNIDLREENYALRKEIKTLKASPVEAKENSPACPNCSTSVKPFYMSKLPKDFENIMGATHTCPRCDYMK